MTNSFKSIAANIRALTGKSAPSHEPTPPPPPPPRTVRVNCSTCDGSGIITSYASLSAGTIAERFYCPVCNPQGRLR